MRQHVKKFWIIFLAFAHLAITVSAAVQPHSCPDEMATQEVGLSTACCEDFEKRVMEADNKKITEALVHSSRFLAQEISLFYSDHHSECLSRLITKPGTAFPFPVAGNISLLVLHCVFRI